MKKILIVLFFLIVFMLQGCNGEDNPNGTVTISFFGWGSAEEQANYQQLVNKFMELNPDIKVTYSAVSSEMYMRNLKNKINNLPDVFYIPDTEFLQWVDAGRLLNLDAYVTEEELADVWSNAIRHYYYDRENFKLGSGSLYAFPKDLGPFALVMNVDLFEKIISTKNLNIEKPDPDIPMTWNEFIALLQKLSGPLGSMNVYGISHYELLAAVYSNNADFFTADGKTQTINSPNFIQALQFIADLDLKYGVMPTADEQASLNGYQRFLNGGAVFTFMGPWDLAGFWQSTTFEFDLVPIPVGPAEGAKSTSWVGSMGIAVSEKSRHKEAAVKLAKFLTIDPISQTMTYQLGQAVPNLMSIAKNDFLNNVGLEGRKTLPKNKQMFLSIIEGNEYISGKPRVTYYTYENIWYDNFLAELIQVYSGSKTASEFLNSYAPIMQADLDESNSYLQ